MNATRHLLLALGLCVCVPTTVRAQPDPPSTPLERAQKLGEQKQFAEAQKILDEQLAQNPSPAHRVLLQNALADVHFDWANYLRQEKTLNPEQAIVHYLAAYETDKVLRLGRAGVCLMEIGGTYYNVKRYEDALKYWRLTSAAFHQINNQQEEVRAFCNTALVCRILEKFPEALSSYEAALPISRERKDPAQQAWLLHQVGEVNLRLNQPEAARSAFDQAIAVLHATGDRVGEAQKMTEAASACERASRYDDAIHFYTLAQPLYQALKNSQREAEIWGEIGRLNLVQGRLDESIRCLNSELEIGEELKSLPIQAHATFWLSANYGNMHRYEDNLRYLEKSLALNREIKSLGGQAIALFHIGIAHANLGRPQEARQDYTQALALYKEAGDGYGEARCLSALSAWEGPEKAIEAKILLLAQARKIKSGYGEAVTLLGLGNTYLGANRSEEALRSFIEASAAYRRINFREGESLWGMARSYARLGKWDDAIAYGKQVVNNYQFVRRENQSLNLDLQRSFLSAVRGTYETLATWLVKQNRLEEAEQILRFLRQEDAFDFVQREPTLGKALATLFDPLVFTPAEKQRLLPEVAATVTEGEGVQESRLWQQALGERERAKWGRAALLSTFNTGDTFTIILTTAKSRRVFSFAIKKSEFDALSVRLQDELSHPTKDPRDDAQKMYQIVFAGGQLEQALQEEGITTALWFPSGSLRYIPIDTLHDGTQYLVQKPRINVLATLTSRNLFEATTQGDALAVGVSQGHDLGDETPGQKGFTFEPLPNVPKEARSIVRDTANGGTGPFPGTILLDDKATIVNLERDLANGVSILHIATHFVLASKDESGSFFLMGNNTRLPLSQWKQALKLRGVGLLTLSACETGIGSPDATGGEVSSIGEVSQYLGAQSVIVSLWPVADSSTSDLMRDFYARLHNAPEQGKAQALRQAQRDLLGDATVAPPGKGERGRPFQETPDKGKGDTATPFVKDPAHPYAHPFYWAPFSLIGNWK